jgi:hypothetical protein
LLWRTNNVAKARLLQRKKARCALVFLREKVTPLKTTVFLTLSKKASAGLEAQEKKEPPRWRKELNGHVSSAAPLV